MQRITDSTAAASLPAPPSLSGLTPGYFTGGVPGSVAATRVRYWWLNMIQEEGMAILAAAGVTPDTTGTVFNQVLTALDTLYGEGRIRLVANLNLYVATTGSDTANNGLTSGAPFATRQKAWNTIIQNYDLAGFTATINVANGTYSDEVFCTSSPVGTTGSIRNEPTQPAPNVIFQGNPATPADVVIDVVAGNCFHVGGGAQVSINGFTLLAGGSSSNYNSEGVALFTFANGGIQFSNIVFGACSNSHIQSTGGSTIESSGNPYTISGGAQSHVSAVSGGYAATASSAITLTGTPNFSAGFAFTTSCGVIYVASATFSGSATGPYYAAATNGVIEGTGGVGTFFPGSTAGSVSSGGQYT